jgi:tight adherence protein C
MSELSAAPALWTWHAAVLGAAAGVLAGAAIAAWDPFARSRRNAPARRLPSACPVVLRRVQPLLAWLAPLVTPLLPAPLRACAALRLQHGDLDGAVAPAEWYALCALVATAMGGLFALVSGNVAAAVAVGLLGASTPELWLADRIHRLTRAIDRDLPHLLGLLTLAVEGGCALGAALRLACDSAHGSPVARAFEHALQEIRAGQPRAAAIARVSTRHPSQGLAALTNALVQADAHGIPIGELLRAQAMQRTEERFARAERLAMQSPVKMLAPLIGCIFPCAFLVLGFPIAVRLMQWA